MTTFTTQNIDNTNVEISIIGARSRGTSNDDIATLVFRNRDLDTRSNYRLATISARDFIGTSDSNGYGSILFSVNDNGTLSNKLKDCMVITHEGHIGINSLSPSCPLYVNGLIKTPSNIESKNITEISNTIQDNSNYLFPSVIFSSNSCVYSSNAATFSSNTFFISSTASVFSSNTSVFSSNTLVTNSNDLYPIVQWSSNALIYSSNASTYSSNALALSSNIFAVEYSSNTSTYTSNLLIENSNYLYPTVQWSSNTATYASNTVITNSNYLYPTVHWSSNTATYASNTVITNSNYLYPTVQWSSNTATYASNILITNSNYLYPTVQWSSNTATYASNTLAFYSSNQTGMFMTNTSNYTSVINLTTSNLPLGKYQLNAIYNYTPRTSEYGSINVKVSESNIGLIIEKKLNTQYQYNSTCTDFILTEFMNTIVSNKIFTLEAMTLGSNDYLSLSNTYVSVRKI